MSAHTTALITVSSLLAAGSLHAFLINDFDADASGVTGQLFGGPGGFEDLNSTSKPVVLQVDSNAGDFLPGVATSTGTGGFLEVRTAFDVPAGGFVVPGDRAIWNDGPQSGGFVDGGGMRVDVFFDDLSFYSASDGFYLQNSLLDDLNADAISGGGFATRVIDLGGGNLVWRVGADGNGRGFSQISGSTIDISAAGWYTMETIWVENLSGGIDQVNRLINVATGISVLEETFLNVILDADDAGQVGFGILGNGDQNLTPSGITAIGIDNISIVPEPETFALTAGILAVFFLTFRRRGRS